MSINHTDTVDIITTSPDGKVVLTISDHHGWDESWHLPLLQDKINAYLQFIESGQILMHYPQAAGKYLVIEAVLKFEPNLEANTFLENAKKIVNNAGIGFQWRLLGFDK